MLSVKKTTTTNFKTLHQLIDSSDSLSFDFSAATIFIFKHIQMQIENPTFL